MIFFFDNEYTTKSENIDSTNFNRVFGRVSTSKFSKSLQFSSFENKFPRFWKVSVFHIFQVYVYRLTLLLMGEAVMFSFF